MTPADRVRLELLAEFRASAHQRLQKIGGLWAAAEASPDTAGEVGQELLRELHTLKGEAKLMGYVDASRIAHLTEDLVLRARERKFQVPEVGDVVLRACDAMGALVDAEPGQPVVDVPAVSQRLQAAAQLLPEAQAPARPERQRTPIVRRTPPAAAPAAPATSATPATSEASTAPLASPTGTPAAPPTEVPVGERELPAHGPPTPQAVREGSLRVDVEHVRRFAEAASESVVAHARYRHLLGKLRAAIGDDPRLSGLLGALDDQLHAGELGARELEQAARQLRMVALAPVFRLHARSLRDLAREHGKKAVLTVIDGDVVVDKNVVDRLQEPLVHLLRNCVDHGVEPPEERVAAGKDELARVTLSAQRAGAEVLVVVEDDGRGVDVDVVRRRAVELGLLGEGQALADADALALLFAPGFSTRRRTTETSGRGVGLDVVKRQVEAMGGTVRVASQRGAGTRFELRVPVSVSLTRALLIELDGRPFAIPTSAVDGVLEIDPDGIALVHTRRTIPVGGERVPLVELAAALAITPGEAGGESRAVLLRHEEQRVAVLVDAWRGDAEVVIKPLPPVIGETRVALGACLLEGGELAIALAPSELIARSLGELPRVRLAAAHDARRARVRRVLLAEDSSITRAMVARLLRMLGYEVREAEDGLRALRLLEEGEVDLVLTDIEMPNLGGIELIERLRAQPALRNLPVVVLSTRGSAQDKERAAVAGADAYLVKTEFSEAALRDVLDRHLGHHGASP